MNDDLLRRKIKIQAGFVIQGTPVRPFIIAAVGRDKITQVFEAIVNMQVYPLRPAIFGFGAVPQFVGNAKTAVCFVFDQPFGLIMIQNRKRLSIAEPYFPKRFDHGATGASGYDVHLMAATNQFAGKIPKIIGIPVYDSVVIDADFKAPFFIHPGFQKLN